MEFITPDGYSFTTANVGDDASDSDANPTNGLTGCYTLSSGENNPTVDAGLVPQLPEIEVQKYVRVDENPIALQKLVAVEPLGNGEEGQAVCQTEGKPVEMVFQYNPSLIFDTMQQEGKGGVNFNGGLDDDENIFVVITDKSDATSSAEALTGETYFSGNVKIGEQFTADNGGDKFNTNVEFYFFDEEGGALLQNAYYHTSCSAPIIMGDGILSATLVGYLGQDSTGMVSLPLPTFVDANDAPGPETAIGSTVEFRYEVTNTGDSAISNLVLTDDRIANVTFVEGDTDNDGKLDTTETWVYSATETAGDGLITNIGVVTGITGNGNTTIAVDTANYTGVGSHSGGSNADCPTGPIGGIDLGNLTKYLFFFANGSEDANWQGATKGFAGDVVVDGLQADERTSGDVPYAGTIYTNDSNLDKWQDIVDQNPGQATAVTGQTQLVVDLEADLLNAFDQINSLTATAGYESVSSTSLSGLNTQDGIAKTYVINITSGLNFSSQIGITGDAGDVFVLRWDTDANFSNGYQGQVKPQSGGAIIPLGGLTAGNFINVAGDLNASGGGSTPAELPQEPIDQSTGTLIDGGSNFSGGGFFTGYWLTTGNPDNGDTASLSNAIFTGGWYTLSDKFSMTSGTSGVHVCPNPETIPTTSDDSSSGNSGTTSINDLLPQIDVNFNANNIGVDGDSAPGAVANRGDIVTFTYEVTNTGDVNLTINDLIDDNATPGDPSDDFTPTYVEGDDGDNIFNPDETWYFQAKELATRAGLNTNIIKVKATDDNNNMVMDDDPANYIINPLDVEKFVAVEPTGGGEMGQAVCETEGKALEMVFEYNPSTLFDTMQQSGKGGINSGSNVLDNDDNIFVVITDKSDATSSAQALSGETYFSGNVKVGEQFTASNGGDKFNNNVEFYFFDEQNGTLLQSAYYHTSCSAPIILGDGILSATLIGYRGEDSTGMVSLPEPTFVDADSANNAPEAVIGTEVEYKYVVSNLGDEALTNVNLTDDKIASLTLVENGNGDNILDAGEKWTYSAFESAVEGLRTNKATVTADLGNVELMDMDHANYKGIDLPAPTGDICEIFGKPEAITFQYVPGTDVLTGQDSSKASIINNVKVDNNGTSFILVTKEGDASKIFGEYLQEGKTDKINFAGNVGFNEYFQANEATNDFGSETFIHFYENDNTGDGVELLQSINYHTSCSQPIQIGDEIGNATLVEYFGEDGSYDNPSIVPVI